MALYPLAYLAIAAVSAIISVTFRGIDDTPPQQDVLDLALGGFMGFLLYAAPALAISFSLVAVVLRWGSPPAHRAVAVLTPPAVYVAWLWWLQPIFFGSWVGVAVTVLAFLALGLATRVPGRATGAS